MCFTLVFQFRKKMFGCDFSVRSGNVKMSCGFQAELYCQIVGASLEDVTTPFTALAINTFMNLLV